MIVTPRDDGNIDVTYPNGAVETFEPLPAGETSGLLFRHGGTYWRRVHHSTDSLAITPVEASNETTHATRTPDPARGRPVRDRRAGAGVPRNADGPGTQSGLFPTGEDK